MIELILFVLFFFGGKDCSQVLGAEEALEKGVYFGCIVKCFSLHSFNCFLCFVFQIAILNFQ